MRIEKVNEHQIRCTLTREDLATRELKISELAYGTEKAKTLFRDMMRQAAYECGFEAEDIPLMIEAIPLNSECIVLIITKVEDPEELDTRFSRFAPSITEENEDGVLSDVSSNEMLDLFRQIQTDTEENKSASVDSSQNSPKTDNKPRTRIFLMKSLQQVMEVSAIISENYHGFSTLYKNEFISGSHNRHGANKAQGYLLMLTQGNDNGDSFDRACNVVSEYGILQRSAAASTAYLAEHFEPLIRNNAVQALGNSGRNI